MNICFGGWNKNPINPVLDSSMLYLHLVVPPAALICLLNIQVIAADVYITYLFGLVAVCRKHPLQLI